MRGAHKEKSDPSGSLFLTTLIEDIEAGPLTYGNPFVGLVDSGV